MAGPAAPPWTASAYARPLSAHLRQCPHMALAEHWRTRPLTTPLPGAPFEMTIDRFDLHRARAAMTELEAAGITLRLGDDGRVYAGPAGKLTPELRQLITQHRDGMVLELSPPRDRELLLRLQELEADLDREKTRRASLAEDALSRIYALEADLAREKNLRLIYEKSVAMMAGHSQPAKAIPADVHRILVSLCHPDRNPERQPAATRAMKWLNAQPRGTAPH